MLDRLRGAKRFLLAGCAVYSALVGMRLIPATQPVADYWIVNIKSLPNFLCAVLIFLGFLRLDFANASPAVFAGVVAGISFAVFLVVSAVDFIRLRFFEPHYMAFPPVKWLCSKISSFYHDC